MLLSSDGRAFVFGVFIGDGAECVDLQNLWDTVELAEAEVGRLKRVPDLFGPLGLYGSHAYVEIRSLEIHGAVDAVDPVVSNSHD